MRKIFVYIFLAAMMNFCGLSCAYSGSLNGRWDCSFEFKNPSGDIIATVTGKGTFDINFNTNGTVDNKPSLSQDHKPSSSSWWPWGASDKQKSKTESETKPKEEEAKKSSEAKKPSEAEEHTWLTKYRFLDKNALEKIVSNENIRLDMEYFTKGDLTYCQIYPNGSPSKYGFIDRRSIRKKLRELYSGGLSVNLRKRSFSFKSSGDEFEALDKIKSIADSALLSLESLKLVSADNGIPGEPKENYGQTQYFFRTDREGVYLVVVRGDRERFYLAAGDSIFDHEELRKLLADNKRIEYDPDSGTMTFNLWTPESELTEQNVNVCIEIFISQLLERCERSDTARW